MLSVAISSSSFVAAYLVFILINMGVPISGVLGGFFFGGKGV